jgi:REP element-mobilizing transposase RayT
MDLCRQNKMPELKTRKQIRLMNHDYSANGYYFVTVCSKNRENSFGNSVGALLACARNNNTVTDNHFELSTCGKIIERQWLDLPNQYDNVELDEYVIMPNHIHGILILNNHAFAGLRAQASSAPTLSQIIRSFKSRSAMEYLKFLKANNLNVSGKIWQRSFYDHVIRNERSLNAIREYILDNPANWKLDMENLLTL